MLSLILLACAQSAPKPASPFVLTNALEPGGAAIEIGVRNGVFVDPESLPDAPRVDARGATLVPAIIDSHVHLAYLPAASGMAQNGVAAAVDLAAPVSFLSKRPSELTVLAAGPMITNLGGYPTQSWGRNGYGAEVADGKGGAQMVGQLVGLGADLIKVPVPSLPEADLALIVSAAKKANVLTTAHALSDADAALAASAGVDVLAHTPVEPMSPETLSAWKGRAVISTLTAFGSSSAAKANLGALSEAGVTVLYGTDFGNTTTEGIQARELEQMAEAGLTPQQIRLSLTSTPAETWGLSQLGSIAEGKEASFLLLGSDPDKNIGAWSDRRAVMIAGSWRKKL